jgi:HK97 family phage prohead protease
MDRITNLKDVEFRTLLDLQLRQDDGQDMPTIVGTAAVFGVLTQLWDDLWERIQPGAFTESLTSGVDVYALVGHDPNMVLGRRGAGTLSIRDEPDGLPVVIRPPNTQVGRDAVESIRRGDTDGMSIGMSVQETSMSMEDGKMIRSVEKAKLRDVSVTTFAAYGDTDVALRSLEAFKQEQAALAAAGMPAKLARQKLDLLELTG